MASSYALSLVALLLLQGAFSVRIELDALSGSSSAEAETQMKYTGSDLVDVMDSNALTAVMEIADDIGMSENYSNAKPRGPGYVVQRSAKPESIIVVRSGRDASKQDAVKKIVKISNGQCTTADGRRENIGWSPCVYGPRLCSFSKCAQECAGIDTCASLIFADPGHCWLYGKLDSPYVRTNNADKRYTCYAVAEKFSYTISSFTPSRLPGLQCNKKTGFTDPEIGSLNKVMAAMHKVVYKGIPYVVTFTLCTIHCKKYKSCAAITWHPEFGLCQLLTSNYKAYFNSRNLAAGRVFSNKCML